LVSEDDQTKMNPYGTKFEVGLGKEDDRDRRYHDLLTLSRVSAAVSGLQDLDAILGVGLDNVLKLMNGHMGGILLLDKRTQMLSYRVHRGMSGDYIDNLRVNLGEGMTGWVAQSGKSILKEDITGDPRLHEYPEWVRASGLKCFICVPLRARDKILGVITVSSNVPRGFTKDDMYLLHSIGDQLGVAIEQAQLYEQLRRGRERYRQLARQVIMAREEERKRIARELHDETSQSLSGLALNLQALVEMSDMSPQKDEQFILRLKKAQGLAVHIGKEVSRLINDLRPTLLDTLGLIPAIRHYAETTLEPRGINVSLEFKGGEGQLPPEVEAGLFRVAQGAIGNIAKHSQARNSWVTLDRDAKELVLTLRDDGKGFNVSELTQIDEKGRGRGVFSMKERVRMLGGRCSIESQPGHGTTVNVRIPLVLGGGTHGENKGAGSR